MNVQQTFNLVCSDAPPKPTNFAVNVTLQTNLLSANWLASGAPTAAFDVYWARTPALNQTWNLLQSYTATAGATNYTNFGVQI